MGKSVQIFFLGEWLKKETYTQSYALLSGYYYNAQIDHLGPQKVISVSRCSFGIIPFFLEILIYG